ncbi:MAG: M23 family metallopeptidase [Bacteroidetes bacterium]|nr:M23 family metallopeptidase [Bacteroidota bacterium]MBU1718653.1 M23 family metallopeptidase [Bacteroidota bacterium]
MVSDKKKSKFWDKLKLKYKLVIMAQDTFEEKFSLNLSRLNVFIVFVALGIFLVFITSVIIAFTPLREYIPGYSSDYKIRDDVIELATRVDSLTEDLQYKETYIQNIKNVISGDPSLFEVPDDTVPTSQKYDSIRNQPSPEDSILRAEFDQIEEYAVMEEQGLRPYNDIRSYFFFAPVKGTIINGYNPAERHYGVDIAAAENEPVKAALDGTIIISGWTIETGYIIAIQHTADLITVYRHNSALTKKEGDIVRAGEVIAIIGNTGENTSGPHLHFELWYKGNPVNPKTYIAF